MASPAIMREAPSRTGSSGRKESDRYSKKASTRAFLPRALARAAALTSASVCPPEPEPEPAPSHGAGAEAAISAAQSYLGVPYVWAGESYDGVDCSGLTMLAYQAAGIELTHSSRVQYGEGEQVDLDDAQPGDLIFWSSDGTQEGIYHVAIYLGDDEMIEAPTFGVPVQITSVRYSDIMPYAVRP